MSLDVGVCVCVIEHSPIEHQTQAYVRIYLMGFMKIGTIAPRAGFECTFPTNPGLAYIMHSIMEIADLGRYSKLILY